MSRRKDFSPEGIHSRTLTDVKAGSPVVTRDGLGRYRDRIALSGVIRGADFLVVWVCRAEERNAALREGREPDGVPWPAEDVWLPADAPEAPGITKHAPDVTVNGISAVEVLARHRDKHPGGCDG